MKMLDVWIFNFIIINLVKKGIWTLMLTTVVDMCMKEVTECCLRQ